ncbi:uncharacterized protein LOC112558915 isoform X2 [Pomacea canaliculata]|uniref:uncharacterized protein LOC112558915 isoform X2 n=1 Tax=Pomacea canaliculata TaxID=400727 RepID=UPI000D72C14B|nr:uncharacterized protein LOC112558915 isoform X2 [Pomacea canaliculata]XP_025085458.1 uncharacterized protein LOC112558915 isoform X2 [Pomacea canaliculata]
MSHEGQNCTFSRIAEINGHSELNSSLQSETKFCLYGCCVGNCCYPEHFSSIMWISLTIFGTAAVLSAVVVSLFYLCWMKRQKPRVVMVTTAGSGLRGSLQRGLHQNSTYCPCHLSLSTGYTPSAPGGLSPLSSASAYLPMSPANYTQPFVATYQLNPLVDLSRPPVLGAYPLATSVAYPHGGPVHVDANLLPPSYAQHEAGDGCAEQTARETPSVPQPPASAR